MMTVQDDGVRGAKPYGTDARARQKNEEERVGARARGGERAARGGERKGACARRTCVRMPRPGVLFS
jgi:hypothetical protein